MNRYHLVVPIAVTIAVATGAADALEIRASGDLAVEHTDNALKRSAQEMSETQEQIALAVSGEHGGDRLAADFNYRVDHRFYNEDSQSERTVVEGRAALRWEQISEALFWDLSHSRRDVLRDNALTDLRENRDERDITELSPMFLMRLTPADSLQARLSYSLVGYRQAENLDSERFGGSLTWVRGLSPTDTLYVAIDTNEVDFDSRLQDDYRYDAATVAYSAQLARLNYRVTLGYNRGVRDRGSDVGGPLVALDATYDDGLNQWYTRLDSRITDSSIGDGNRDIFDWVDIADTTIGSVDLLRKSRLEAGVTSAALCDLCELRGAIFYDREDYETQPRDNDEYGAQAGLRYRLSRVSSVGATYRYRSVEYKGNNIRSDYDQNEMLVEYSRTITRALSGKAFVGYIDRSGGSSSGGQGYDETRFGVRLSYQFL